jgi:CheY-like chemotaxis protein
MIAPHRRLLIVDDNRAIHDDLRKILGPRASSEVSELESALFGIEPPPAAAAAFHLTSAYQGQEGVERVRDACRTGSRFALAIVDMRMPPGLDGVETIARMWELDPALQVVICTAFSDASWSEIVARFGATDRLLILKKPFDLVEVCQLACALTEKWRLAEEARAQMTELVRSRAELAAGLGLARAVQEATVDGILMVGADRRVATANQRFLDMWGIPTDVHATGEDERLLGYVLDQLLDPSEFIARVRHLYDHPDQCASDEICLRDGRVFERWTSPVRSAGDEIQGRLWCFRDISEPSRPSAWPRSGG